MIDILLVNFPSKAIDIPPLGTSILSGYLQEQGYICRQVDYNIIIKNQLLEEGNLERLYYEIVPYLWEQFISLYHYSNIIADFGNSLCEIKNKFSFRNLENVKLLLQERQFESVFCDSDNSNIFKLLIKTIGLSSVLLDALILSPNIEKTFPDLFVFTEVKKLFESVFEKKPLLLGFSIVELQRNYTMWAIKKLRKLYGYKGKIVLGGADITYHHNYPKYFPEIDYAIRCEGERSVSELIDYLKGNKRSRKDIPNLIYIRHGELVKNKTSYHSTFCQTLPDFNDLPLNYYLTNALPVQASRGCSWGKCSYCRHFRTYSSDYYEGKSENIVDQIEKLQSKYHTSIFHFVDDDLPSSLKLSIIECLQHRNISIKWLAYSRFENNISKEDLIKWYKGGLCVVEWGLESASQKVLKSVKKGISVKKASELLCLSYDVGILNKVFMFHNLPKESHEDLLKSIEFLKKYVMHGIIRPFWEILTPLELLVGTPLYDQAMEKGVEAPDRLFKRAFPPRGDLVVQAKYVHLHDYDIKKQMIAKAVSDLKSVSDQHNILEMNDETVMFDVIIEMIREKGEHELVLECRLPQCLPTSENNEVNCKIL